MLEKTYSSFPHELSGGQKQRVVIAVALAGEPRLLIADEPTTSLDPSTRKSVLDLILKIKKNRGLGVLLISHDIELINYFCDKIYVFKDCSFHESSLLVAKKHLAKKQKVYDSIRGRVFEKTGKKLLGPLFFKQMETKPNNELIRNFV